MVPVVATVRKVGRLCVWGAMQAIHAPSCAGGTPAANGVAVFPNRAPNNPAGTPTINDTENADIRVHDAMCLTDPMVSELLDRHNIKRISFRELRGLQRGG